MTTNAYSEDKNKSLVSKGYYSQSSTEEKKPRSSASNSKDSNNYDPGKEISDVPWTNNCLTDKLVYRLGSTSSYKINAVSKEILITHKYYDQAEWVLYHINIHKPPPQFVINLSDLTRKLKEEISSLRPTPSTLNEVITTAVRRMLESVNPEYYHVNGIYGKVAWRLDP
jgi:hypothetical protein